VINYIKGDLFKLLPEDDNFKIIPHVVNDEGAWGSGFVVPVSEKWPMELEFESPEYVYRNEHESQNGLVLGKVQWSYPVKSNQLSTVAVVNMIAQHQTIRSIEKPIRYEALISCMCEVRDQLLRRLEMKGKWHNQDDEIHCPKFGSDRAGGTWEFIVELIEELWCPYAPVTVYEL